VGDSLAVVHAADPTQSAAATNEPARLEAESHEGRRFGDYQLIAELAHCGMGIVYLAIRRGQLVVLKALRNEFLDNPALVGMFMEEGRVAALLNHANILRTIEVGKEGARPFIAMEHVEGRSLHQIVQRAVLRSKRMPLAMHLRVLREVLSALECAHNATGGEGPVVVHGDVNPRNVLITYGGAVKLIDFGISEMFGAVVENGNEAALVEKVRYTAPEEATGEAVDGRADLFAVGVMLWEAIADRGPWADKPDAAVLQSLRAGAIPRVREAWPYIDATLGAIVDRSLTFAPSQRYQTALAMRLDLERYIETRHIRLASAQVLGDFVSRLFAEEQEKERSQVDPQLGPVPRTDAMSLPDSPAPRKAQANVQPLTFPLVPRRVSRRAPTIHAPGRSRTVLPIAVSACLGAFIALAAVSATRLRAGQAPETVATPRASVATLMRPAIPVISIDDIPSVPNLVVAPPPTTTLPSGPKSIARDARALPPVVESSDCQPPYTVDPRTGKKQWRLDCL
jgi:serine/threonine-protein kinase